MKNLIPVLLILTSCTQLPKTNSSNRFELMINSDMETELYLEVTGYLSKLDGVAAGADIYEDSDALEAYDLLRCFSVVFDASHAEQLSKLNQKKVSVVGRVVPSVSLLLMPEVQSLKVEGREWRGTSCQAPRMLILDQVVRADR